MARKRITKYQVVSSTPVRLTRPDGVSIVVSRHDPPAIYKRDHAFERALGRGLNEVYEWVEDAPVVPAPVVAKVQAPAPVAEPAPVVEAPADHGSDEPIEDLDIPERLMGLLIDAGYSTVWELEGASDEEILAIQGIGSGSLSAIRSAISSIAD